MAIAQKVISGNDQPAGGKGIVAIGGQRGLGENGTLLTDVASTNILTPPLITDPPIGWLNSKYDDRLDEINYYYNSGSIDGGSP